MYALGSDPDTHTLAMALLDSERGTLARLLWWWVSDVPRNLTGDAALVALSKQINTLTAPAAFAHTCAVEAMRVYPDTPLGTEGLTGLMRVSVAGGLALAWCEKQFPSARIAMPTAPEWKGQRDKPADHRRSLKLLDVESREALAFVGRRFRGHLLDAVGIALWAAGEGGARDETRRGIKERAKQRAKRARR